MIKIFVNSVFVYDDKVVLTFNYSGDDRTITLQEIDAGLQQGVRLPRGAAYHSSQASYRLPTSFFVSLQNLSRTHFAAPRFQTEAQRSGFGLVFGTDL